MRDRYTPNPLDTSKIELPDEIVVLMEEIARNVHEVWAAGRISDGWIYGDVRSDEKKTHPCLVPYDALPEQEKEYDRQTARETLMAIQLLGYEIKKRGGL